MCSSVSSCSSDEFDEYERAVKETILIPAATNNDTTNTAPAKVVGDSKH